MSAVVPVGLEGVLSVDADVMHGALCFTGTRIPVTVFLDNLKEGMGLDEFLEEYPSVKRHFALAVLEWEGDSLLKAAGIQRAG